MAAEFLKNTIHLAQIAGISIIDGNSGSPRDDRRKLASLKEKRAVYSAALDAVDFGLGPT